MFISTANEDLMKEHGLLNRILLIYDQIIYHLEQQRSINPNLILIPAFLIRKFIEDYHEKNEEKYIFPILLKTENYVNLVNELIKQHQIGRILTNQIIVLTNGLFNDKTRSEIINSIKLFTEMYCHHESREDTEVFPAYKKLVSNEEYNKVGELFEESEEQLFGEQGFEKILEIVKLIEVKLNTNDISKQTKKIEEFIEYHSIISKLQQDQIQDQ